MKKNIIKKNSDSGTYVRKYICMKSKLRSVLMNEWERHHRSEIKRYVCDRPYAERFIYNWIVNHHWIFISVNQSPIGISIVIIPSTEEILKRGESDVCSSESHWRIGKEFRRANNERNQRSSIKLFGHQ